jgi:hypothetical protein
LVEAGLVVVLGVVVLDGLAGTAGVLGVTAGGFGVVVVPIEVVPVVELPVEFEDCGTADPPAGTQFAPLAVLEELGIVLVDELGVDAVVEVLEVELGDVLELALGDVLLADDVLGEVEELAVVLVPVALTLVFGTMPGGQLFDGEVDELLGVVVVEVLLCDEGVVPIPDCEAGADVDGVVLVVEFVVVDVVCAATHVAPAVRIKSNVNFFMFSVLVKSSGSQCDARSWGRVRRQVPKKWAGMTGPGLRLSERYLRTLRRSHAPRPIDPEPSMVSSGRGEAVCGNLPLCFPLVSLGAFWSELVLGAAAPVSGLVPLVPCAPVD